MTMPAPDQKTLREAIAAAAQGRYVLCNVRLNKAVTGAGAIETAGAEFFFADLTVEHGRILATTPTDAPEALHADDMARIDCRGRIALPTFIDCHTHLDKGHILPRTPKADGTFAGALAATRADRTACWSADDVARRMDFALRSAYHYGTSAIRTHLDSQPPQDAISWPVFRDMREQWRGQIELQAACLFPIDFARDEAFLKGMAKRVNEAGGILGAVAYPAPDLDELLDRMFAAATKYGLDLDFHADETADPSADGLRRIAEAALRARFAGKVLVGHCCSLAMQDSATIDETLDKVAAAGLSVVSLPTCNLYLQDRHHDGTTPKWRGVTLLHEMKRRGIAVALGSDNTRDPFHSYGDLDMLDTYRLGTRVLHLDHPIGDWPRAVSATPAAIMGLDGKGVIAEGQAADFILFDGRSWSEVLSRSEANRIVVRHGAPIATSLPSYAELDEAFG
ncbi:cytosine deaminase [Aminobacter aminovorans]|uniref:Cytosine deaminase n=1 Tax=Aminobacter aminovorans TaxID=83263 RepID=A0AAC8YW21_AMIAI|nr:cytosine deaminase [Aminobacter aminovorans]AMS45354.1 Cytosine deaminase-like protein [Aminobacter aminovorans]MBB3710376.1 cytosine deaminase [Aminobacter aminovorans]